MKYSILLLFVLNSALALDVGFGDDTAHFLKVEPIFDQANETAKDKFKFYLCDLSQENCQVISKCFISREDFLSSADASIRSKNLRDEMGQVLDQSFMSEYKSKPFLQTLKLILTVHFADQKKCLPKPSTGNNAV